MLLEFNYSIITTSSNILHEYVRDCYTYDTLLYHRDQHGSHVLTLYYCNESARMSDIKTISCNLQINATLLECHMLDKYV